MQRISAITGDVASVFPGNNDNSKIYGVHRYIFIEIILAWVMSLCFIEHKKTIQRSGKDIYAKFLSNRTDGTSDWICDP